MCLKCSCCRQCVYLETKSWFHLNRNVKNFKLISFHLLVCWTLDCDLIILLLFSSLYNCNLPYWSLLEWQTAKGFFQPFDSFSAPVFLHSFFLPSYLSFLCSSTLKLCCVLKTWFAYMGKGSWLHFSTILRWVHSFLKKCSKR